MFIFDLLNQKKDTIFNVLDKKKNETVFDILMRHKNDHLIFDILAKKPSFTPIIDYDRSFKKPIYTNKETIINEISLEIGEQTKEKIGIGDENLILQDEFPNNPKQGQVVNVQNTIFRFENES